MCININILIKILNILIIAKIYIIFYPIKINFWDLNDYFYKI